MAHYSYRYLFSYIFLLLFFCIFDLVVNYGWPDFLTTDPPLNSMVHHSNQIWIAEDKSYAFVIDSYGYCFGLVEGSNAVLCLMIDAYSSEEHGYTFKIYATEEFQLEEAFEATQKQGSLQPMRLVDLGSAKPIGKSNGRIEVIMDDGTTLCFVRNELSQKWSFEDTSEWPQEMLDWIESPKI